MGLTTYNPRVLREDGRCRAYCEPSGCSRCPLPVIDSLLFCARHEMDHRASLAEMKRIRELSCDELGSYAATDNKTDSLRFLRMYIFWLEKELELHANHQKQFQCLSEYFTSARCEYKYNELNRNVEAKLAELKDERTRAETLLINESRYRDEPEQRSGILRSVSGINSDPTALY